jgi:hypothetical protein
MDAKLAEIYGTNTPDQDDVEKLAAAELAEELSGDEQVDTEGLTEEQLEAVAEEVLAAGEETKQTEETEEQEETEGTDEMAEKVAEADHLGRVMAHSMVHELRSIEKQASSAYAKGYERTFGPKGLGKVVGHLKGLGGKAKAMGAAGAEKAKAVGKAGAAKAKAGAEKAKTHVKAHGKKYSAGAGAVGGAAAGAAAMKMKEKKSSALDTLVERRAMEILEASGIDPNSLEQVQQKEASAEFDPKAVLAERVEQGAWELLAQYGVEPAEQTEE